MAFLAIQLGGVRQAAGGTPFTVVASGLANPRGLAFDGSGRLYVSEAGLGKGDPGTGVKPGVGDSGLIQVITHAGSRHPAIDTLVSGLWSASGFEGGEIETVGPAGIAVNLRGHSVLSVISGADPTNAQSGHLLNVSDDGIDTVADISAADFAWEAQYPVNPDFPDANPYAVAAVGRRIFAIDAASNTLDEVSRTGTVRVVAYFPKPDSHISDSVPTCVAPGPDGALYVGTLAIAAGRGQAKVFRVDPDTTESVFAAGSHVWASGLSTINGCAFSPDGRSFYASEFIAMEFITGTFRGPPPGAVVKIPFANPSSHTPLAFGALHFPGGVAVSAGGSVYVSNWSNIPPGVPLLGQVVRLY